MGKKLKKLKIFKWTCLVFYIICAFVLIIESCMDGKKSSSQSNAVGGAVANIVNDIGGDQTVNIIPTKVEIINKIQNAYVGDSLQLNVKTSPTDATFKSLIFSSSNEDVATISNDGMVSFHQKGATTLTVCNEQYPKLKDKMDVLVSNVEASALKCSLNADKVENGIYYLDVHQDNYKIAVNILPENTTNKTVKFTCDETKYISINENGDITTKQYSNGEITTISVSLGTLKKEFKVIVDMDIIALNSLKVDKPTNSIYPTQQVTPKVTFDPTNATFKGYKLVSSNSKIVSVTSKSYKGVAAGEAIVKVISTKYDHILANIQVTVLKAPTLKSFTASLASSLTIGTKSKISIKNISPKYASTSSIIYTSATPDIASVDKKGYVSALSVGNGKIILSDKNKLFADKEINFKVIEREDVLDHTQDFIIDYVEGIKPYALTNSTIHIPSYFKVSQFICEEGYQTTNTAMSYTVLKTSTAKYENIDETHIKLLSTGTIHISITHKASKIVKNVSLTVIHDFKIQSSNHEREDIYSLDERKSYNFTIISEDDPLQKYIFNNQNPTVGTITSLDDLNFTINASSAGKLNLEITPIYNEEECHNVTKTITFTVNSVLAKFVDITGYNQTLKQEIVFQDGLTYEMPINHQITLTSQYDPNATIKNLLFKSSNEAVLSISQKGVIKTKKIGEADITLVDTYSKQEKTIHILVKNIIELQNVKLIGNQATYDSNSKRYSITNGYSGKIVVNFSKNTTYKKITYSSSDESILKVGKDSSLTPLKPGIVTITMTCDDGMAKPYVATITVEVRKQNLIQDLSKFFLIIRKSLGHFGAFLVFGIFSTLTYLLFFKKKLLFIFAPFNFLQGFLLAALTEYIQTFVPGRHGCFSDVMIDFTGFLCSAIIITISFLIYFIIKWQKNKKLTSTQTIDENASV